MRALVKFERGPGRMEVREVRDPIAGHNEVVVGVQACGVDRGGDLYLWHSAPGMPYEVPVIVGAENCGEVVEVGPGVDGWEPGDRVVCEVIVGSCERCQACLSGRYLHCPQKRDIGRRVDGAFAEYLKAPATRLHRIPDNVSWRAAVLTEMAAVVARNLLEEVRISAGDSVAIVGPGPIGLIATQLAVASGALPIVIGRAGDETRLELARTFGALATVESDGEGYEDRIRDLEPNGFQLVVEATGSTSGVGVALQAARPHATIAAIGTPVGADVTLPWAEVAMKDLTIRGTYAHTWQTFERVLALMGSGGIQADSLYSASYPLDRWEEAFTLVESSTNLVKVGLCPGDLI